MQEQEPTDDYIKGYNQGYLIAEHMPELAGKLPSTLSKSERGKGLLDGQTQYMLEQNKQHLPSWLQKDRLADPGKQPEKGKDELDRD